MQMNGVSVLIRGREREKESEHTSLFTWDYICLGLGWTRCFFKIINQFPKLLWAF